MMVSLHQNQRSCPFLGVLVIGLCLLFSSLPSLASPATSFEWLATKINPDGSYTQTSDIATSYQATSEVLRAAKRYNQNAQINSAAALAFINAETLLSTETLSRKIIAAAEAGSGVAILVDELKAMARADGGFGEFAEFQSTALDTAFALQALNIAGYGNIPVANSGIQFLLSTQIADGGWSIGTNDSGVYVTAMAVIALSPYKSQFSAVPARLNAAHNFLLSQRDGSGSWSKDYSSAVALIALLSDGAEASLLRAGAEALTNRQASNGSWSDDVYTTALVLRALALYNAANSGAAGTQVGTVAGYVVKENGHEPLANVEISLASVAGYSVLSDSIGYFKMTGVPIGTQTILAHKSGYNDLSRVVNVQYDQISEAGILALSADPKTGAVTGHIEGSQDHAAIEGASVTLTGAQGSSSRVSDSSGNFEWSTLTPGDYTVQIDKSGYYSVNGALTVAGGASVTLSQSLIKVGTYLDDTLGDVIGKVVDGESGQPLSGAHIEMVGGATVATGSDGSFVFKALPSGSYQALLTADGYQSQSLSFVFSPGTIGDLGVLRLYLFGGTVVPSALALSGRVIDGLNGTAINNATVEWIETGEKVQTGTDGTFAIAGIDTLHFTLAITAPSFAQKTFSINAVGFGEVFQEFSLPPDNGDTNVTTSALSGIVKNNVTGLPIAGAKVALQAGQGTTVTTGSTGQFEFTGIADLDFTLNASAEGYFATTRQLNLSMHGSYSTEIVLEPQEAGAESFQIVSLTPPPQAAGANETLLFSAEIANLLDTDQEAIVLGEIVNAEGMPITTVSPYAPDTTEPVSQFHFTAKESKVLIVPWLTAQTAPGTYRLILRTIKPGTIDRSLPFGQVLAENQAFGKIVSTSTFGGAFDLNPPLLQAGSQTPVKLDVFLGNIGNTGLSNVPLTLTIEQPDTGAILHQVTTTLDNLAVNDYRYLSFGEWTPTAEGNLPLRIRTADGTVGGEITGTLYVGDKAAGEFSVDRSIVLEGTQAVHGKIALQGVDTVGGKATDPLFVAVRNAVKTGGEYTASGAMLWQKTNRCSGCHIQTQSLVGVASAFQKNLGDETAAINLYNSVASTQQNDGGLRANHPEYAKTQAVLGAWSLTTWNGEESFRTLYRTAQYLYGRRMQSSNQTWWTPDYPYGWWYSNESHTALTVKAYTHLLKTAQTADLSKINDYRLDSQALLGSGTSPRDVEMAADGFLYTVKSTGEIVRIDTGSNNVESVAKLSIDGYGIAVAEDGTIYVSGNGGKLLRRNLNGTVDTLLSGSGYLTDVEISPDGRVYVVDYSNRRILRLNDSGQWETWVSGGVLNAPYGMTFDEAGNAYIANFGGFNIVKVDPAKNISIFADGLAYQPLYIDHKPSGGFYYSSYQYSNSGQYTPSAINALSAKGVVERLTSASGTLMGVAVSDNGHTYTVNATENKLYQLISFPLNTSQLSNYATEITRAVNYFLARNSDGTTDNIIQAMRLTGLAEARKVISDAVLNTQIDTAITAIGNTLRTRQRSDGGWGRYTGWGSDAMVTALVGLALDYTNPSADDPLVRKTIQYLLSVQQGDHSWYSSNGILSTRLAATSLVVTYLPIAMERLGGIDVDLHVNFPASVVLSNSVPVPTAQTANVNGGIDYLWKLVGVTANQRTLDFDLTLQNMTLKEQRRVADAAYIEFNNSFTDEKLRVDLEIPSVKAASDLALSLTTDRNNYTANETVLIRPTVMNTGPTAAQGTVEVNIRAAEAEENLATLAPPLTVPSMAAGASLALETPWNTGSTLIGNYEAHARLLDSQGRVLDEVAAPFQIVSSAAAQIDGRVVTDKPIYAAWDTVNIDARVENITSNAIQPPTRVDITVTTPGGQIILNQSTSLGELVPGALRDLEFSLNLSDAVSGDYQVAMTVKDDFSRNIIITRATTFRVERQAVQALTGKVTTASAQLYQGDLGQCMETANYLSSMPADAVNLTSQLVNMDTGQVINETTRTASMSSGQTLIDIRSITTDSLAVGAYACILTGEIDGISRKLGFAGFEVLAPPIRIDAHLNAGDRGRVLVLLDDDANQCVEVNRLNLEVELSVPLTASASVEVQLFDPLGTLIDSETAALDARNINQHGLQQNMGLTIEDFSRDHLSVQIDGAKGFGSNVKMVAQISDAQLALTKASGIVAAACPAPVTVGGVYGDFRLTAVQRLLAANDPLGPNHIPDLASQRTVLETLLTQAGWSYTIVTDEAHFAQQLHTGGYAAYLLLSEQVKLDEPLQKELREAVYRGEGLVEAGSHDQRQGRIDDILGIKFLGKHPGMSGVTVLATEAHTPGQALFSLTDRTLKADNLNAESLGRFSNTEAVAMTSRSYGAGRADYFGFDLLAEAAMPGADPLYADLLLDALEHVHPNALKPLAGGVYPLQLRLANQGIATAGQATLTLPAGIGVIDKGAATVINNTLVWPFELIPEQTQALDTWISLPATPGPITALIQTGVSPDFKDYATLVLDIAPLAPPTLEEILIDVQALDPAIYKQVIKYLQWAIQDQNKGNISSALASLIRASDALIDIGPGADAAIRLQIAEAMRTLSQKL